MYLYLNIKHSCNDEILKVGRDKVGLRKVFINSRNKMLCLNIQNLAVLKAFTKLCKKYFE